MASNIFQSSLFRGILEWVASFGLSESCIAKGTLYAAQSIGALRLMIAQKIVAPVKTGVQSFGYYP